MKILDNKKDYYDYLMGIYGIDEKIFYNRWGSKTFDYIKRDWQDPNWFTVMDVRIGFKVWHLTKDKDGKWVMPKTTLQWTGKYSWGKGGYIDLPNPRTVEDLEKYHKINPDDRFHPIVVTLYGDDRWGRNYGRTYTNPILSSFPAIAKFIPATEVWDNVYDFISASLDKPIVDNRTDKEHIISAGFDPKTSFRNM